MKHWVTFFLSIAVSFYCLKLSAQETSFQSTISTTQKPWTKSGFYNDPALFQFAIVTDRTGGHRDGVFEDGVKKLNLMMPEFVMSVGDLIEGYTKESAEIDTQWAEFNSFVDTLQMRFFYVPGNHDISNQVMREAWLQRYGHAYYHFTYKNVLFLALDSNDGDDDATFSDAQIEYMKKAIAENPNVRWTLLFMHHPVWLYKSLNRFDEIENALKDRPYTVFAGHFHQYMQALRQDRNYYVLATTGGGSEMRGPKFGEFDHITWVTMTENGPKMVNLNLDGFIEHDVTTVQDLAKKRALIQAADFNTLVTTNVDKTAGKVWYSIPNQSADTIYFKGRIYHNHHIAVNQSKFDLVIAPKSIVNMALDWKLTGDMVWERVDPIEMDFTIGYKAEPFDPPFELSGVFAIPKFIKADQIQFTELDVFTTKQTVSLASDFEEVDIRYTLDGSIPTTSSPKYEKPIELMETTTIKAAYFEPNQASQTRYLEKLYRKVTALEPVKVKKLVAGLRYNYFEGNFVTLPNFSTLTPTKSGIANSFDLEAIAGRLDHYAIEFNGYIEVPEDGLYNFFLHSDDGAKLFIHNGLVVDNDGSHEARTRNGYVALKKGLHPIRIEYFEDFLGQEINLSWQLPSASTPEKVDAKLLMHQK